MKSIPHKWCIGVVLLCLAVGAFGQTPVALPPPPQFVSYLQNGSPNAFGCVFTYQSGTSTPLTTYTDSTGVTANANPVILSAGGTAGIWIQAGQAYTFVVDSAGGTNCVSGSLQYTVNGIGGTSSYNSTTVTPVGGSATFTATAQNQLFLLTLTGNVTSVALTAVGVTPPGWLTFQITQGSGGGFTFSWPSNVIGGCTIGSNSNQVTSQSFVWNGTNAYAIGPCSTGTGPSISEGATSVFGNLIATGTVQGDTLSATVSTGTAPLTIQSTTEVTHLNSNFLEGADWASPGIIGSTAPAAITGTDIVANSSFTLNGGTTQTGTQGTDTKLLTAGTVSGSAGVILCTDSNHGATTSGCSTGLVTRTGTNSSPCTTSGADAGAGACTSVVNWNAAFADTSYVATCTGVSYSGSPHIVDINTLTTTSVTVTIGNGSSAQATPSTYASIQCIGVHP